MRLKAYLDSKEISPAAFAERIGVHMVTIYKYVAGERMPRPAILEAIRRETDGQVTADDFHQHVFERAAA